MGCHFEDVREDAGVQPLSQQILRTDVSGMPLEWVDYREAARLYHTGQVAYTCGTTLYRLYGGTSARTGLRTIVDVNSIIATLGHTGNPGNLRGAAYTPPLNNQTLFRRDAYLCLYCGARFPYGLLSRDHVTPFSRNLQVGGAVSRLLDPVTHAGAALLNATLDQQAQIISFIDAFKFMMIVSIPTMLCLLLMRRPPQAAMAAKAEKPEMAVME